MQRESRQGSGEEGVSRTAAERLGKAGSSQGTQVRSGCWGPLPVGAGVGVGAWPLGAAWTQELCRAGNGVNLAVKACRKPHRLLLFAPKPAELALKCC
jgi:hypothetical protein